MSMKLRSSENGKASLLDELSWRGLVYQHTDGLADALATGEVSAYVGFDPTASSLHIGNLVPVMGVAHLQRAGDKPVDGKQLEVRGAAGHRRGRAGRGWGALLGARGSADHA